MKLKNKIALASLLTLLASQAVFANDFLQKGTQEIGIQGSVDFDYIDSYQVLLQGSYGYFIQDGWEVGGDLDVNASGSYKSVAVGVFTEYNFLNKSKFVPYIGASTQLMHANYDGGVGGDAFNPTAMNFKVKLGAKYFINKNVALSAEVNHNIATDNIHISGEDAKKSLTKILIGTRFYW